MQTRVRTKYYSLDDAKRSVDTNSPRRKRPHMRTNAEEDAEVIMILVKRDETLSVPEDHTVNERRVYINFLVDVGVYVQIGNSRPSGGVRGSLCR